MRARSVTAQKPVQGARLRRRRQRRIAALFQSRPAGAIGQSGHRPRDPLQCSPQPLGPETLGPDIRWSANMNNAAKVVANIRTTNTSERMTCPTTLATPAILMATSNTGDHPHSRVVVVSTTWCRLTAPCELEKVLREIIGARFSASRQGATDDHVRGAFCTPCQMVRCALAFCMPGRADEKKRAAHI